MFNFLIIEGVSRYESSSQNIPLCIADALSSPSFQISDRSINSLDEFIGTFEVQVTNAFAYN